MRPDEVLDRLGSSPEGLTDAEVLDRRHRLGANVLRAHGPQPFRLLLRQFESPLLLLLLVAAVVSTTVGQGTEAALIAVIVGASVLLGFANEFRAEKTAAALHDRIQQRVGVRRSGAWTSVPLVDLVPGDVVRVGLGSIVPADLRLLAATAVEADESVLTGESMTVDKRVDPSRVDHAGADHAGEAPDDPFVSGLRMGTVIRGGTAEAVVVCTAAHTEFGRLALALGTRHPETEFQKGLRQYSMMLARVAVALAAFVLAANLVRGRPVIDALLFCLAVAVGITPELLPAVVTTSLATGAHRLAARKVLVKRLMCIEDLGDVSVLLTDKTGTLTEGAVSFDHAVAVSGTDDDVMVLGRLAGDRDAGLVGGPANTIDAALAAAAAPLEARVASMTVLAALPFDHQRMISSVLATDDAGCRWIVTKGAPEAVHARCRSVPPDALAACDRQFATGSRVLAVARRAIDHLDTATTTTLEVADERDLELVGYLVFADPVKATAAASIARLVALDIAVKVATGDNAVVARRVCEQLGMEVTGILSGADIDALDDTALVTAAAGATIFARVDPEQKARVLRALRTLGKGVAFMGDGVNDAVALHAADVGISVDTGADVARDAADVVLLEKDLGVLADGVMEGRRIFANTMKYVLIGTSSAFGNMISASAASLFLTFLPMLPAQILLNNLLYEASQLTIPTDRVDDEQLRRPAQWDLRMIRRAMATFGPLSSVFDIATFVLMARVFHASAALFHTGWFIESLATQTAVIFVIRTRRVPFYRSRPSTALTVSTLICIALAVLVPLSPLAGSFEFVTPPLRYFAVLLAIVVVYLGLVDLLKTGIRSTGADVRELPVVPPVARELRVQRRASRWTHRPAVGKPRSDHNPSRAAS